MNTYFCPKCWKTVGADDTTCAHCGADLTSYAALSYEEKLLFALDHPIRENRMMAISILGQLHSQRAIPKFQHILDSEEDFYLLREVLTALATMNDARSRAMLQKATAHPSDLVSSVAKELVRKLENHAGTQPPGLAGKKEAIE